MEVFVFFNLVRKLKQKSRQKKPFENKTTALGSMGLLVPLCRRTQLLSLSNRMNEVMKVLTMIATIFIPMTFVAGLYGMNFDRASPYNLPELGWRFGYIYALGLMVASASIMLFVFWRLGWIFGRVGKDGRDPVSTTEKR